MYHQVTRADNPVPYSALMLVLMHDDVVPADFAYDGRDVVVRVAVNYLTPELIYLDWGHRARAPELVVKRAEVPVPSSE